MEARAFSHERKCAAIKDVNTEHIQAECIFFAFLPVFFAKKCYPQKYPPTEPHILRLLLSDRSDTQKKQEKRKKNKKQPHRNNTNFHTDNVQKKQEIEKGERHD